jgi:hypothetical protein
MHYCVMHARLNINTMSESVWSAHIAALPPVGIFCQFVVVVVCWYIDRSHVAWSVPFNALQYPICSSQKGSFLLLNFPRFSRFPSKHSNPHCAATYYHSCHSPRRNHRIQHSRRVAVGCFAFHGGTPPRTFSFFLFDSWPLYTRRLRRLVALPTFSCCCISYEQIEPDWLAMIQQRSRLFPANAFIPKYYSR